jgi:hypothetical protein
MKDDSALDRIHRIKSSLRQKETPPNTSGKEAVPFCARPQVKNVTPYKSKSGNPSR